MSPRTFLKRWLGGWSSSLPRPEQALSVVFRWDSRVWAKVAIFLYFGWQLLLPKAWRLILLIFASLWCAFGYPCPVGDNVQEHDLAVMSFLDGAALYLEFWWTVYIAALFCSTGWKSKFLGCCGVALFFLAALILAGVFAAVTQYLGTPTEVIYAFLDKLTPVRAWRVR